MAELTRRQRTPVRVPPVLVYHKVDCRSEIGITRLSPRRFARQIEALAGAGWRTLTLGELAATLAGTRPLGAREFVITFDDAYRGLRDYAFPALASVGFTGACAVITDYAGRLNRWDVAIGGRRFAHLAWRDIARWHGRGIEFISHTATHPRLSWLEADDAASELTRSRIALEGALGASVLAIAYPYGAAGARERELARASGYRLGLAVIGRWRGDALAVPRTPVYPWSSALPVVGRWGPLEKSAARIVTRGSVVGAMWRSFRPVAKYALVMATAMGTALATASAQARTPMMATSATSVTPADTTVARRPLRAEDLYRLQDVRDPARSPDGQWVAYVVSAPDSVRDKGHTQLWMTSWDGATTIPLTTDTANESRPRWSPDGRFISFLSARGNANETTQLWLMSRQGGEGVRVTSFRGDVSDYSWSPDGGRIAIVVEDNPEAMGADSMRRDTGAVLGGADTKKPKPIVIDRYHFKEDVVGYLGKKRDHLYLFDVATRTSRIITPGSFDEGNPSWSPDGQRVAFVSKRTPADVDRANNWDVFVVDTEPGAVPKQLTTWAGADNPPAAGRMAWSPDGAMIAYVRGSADPRLVAYDQFELAVVGASGGEPRVLTAALDRGVSQPQWSADGRGITVLVEDDRSIYPARVDVGSGSVTRILPGALVVAAMTVGRDDAITALVATDSTPPEVCAIEHGAVRRLTHRNDAWLARIQLGLTEDFASRSKDGTDVHGVLVRPPGSIGARRAPTLLRIHGGPNGQDQHDFSFERQLFAANGYVVVSANYRGSSGRGAKFQRAIVADWGHNEVIDLLGAVDRVVAMGIADSARLGIGGWSYGGILTDYTIATDPRFKAAISGAGSALQLSMYGVDEYITQYVAELGQPWEHPDLWMKVSYPFFHVTRISTPTLFLGGDQDFNVPLIGGEQMYQALRVRNIPTQLVIYPEQFHGLTRPSFKVDRLRRYLDWYAKYLGPELSTAARSIR